MKRVYQFNEKGELLNSYKSIAEAARAVGVSKAALGVAVNGKRTSAAGSLWSFNDEIKVESIKNDVEWRDIKGFEGLYQISLDREVRRLAYGVRQVDDKGNEYVRHFPEKILKQNIDDGGYLYVNMDGDRYRIHWLFYNTFIGDSKGYVIDHIDRNKLNNDPSNLRLLTPDLNKRNKTLPYKPAITNMNKYYQKEHKETRGGMSKPYMLKFTEDKKSKHYYFSTYEEAENKYRELYIERQKRIDASSKVFTINS